MEVAALIEALRAEGDPMTGAVAATSPDAFVPTCPEWVLRDLVWHMGGVHRWATGIVATPHTEMWAAELDDIVGIWPSDEDLAPWFHSGHATLVAALEAAPPDLECWTFLRAPSPLAMWARRQAHETAIHRVDAELASGRAVGALSPLAPAFAADGVDELLGCFVPRRSTQLRSEAPTSMVVRCTDDDAGWALLIDAEGVDTTPAAAANTGGADCTVRGRASDLYLVLWNRADPGLLSVEGDAGVLGLFLDGVHVRRA